MTPFWLEAEAIAAPLVSLDALSGAWTRTQSEDLQPHCEDVYAELSARSGVVLASDHRKSVLRAHLLDEPVLEHLGRHATRLLERHADCARLKILRSDPGAELLRWRCVSACLPPSILVALAWPAGSWPPWRVELLDPTLRPVGPIAHLHVHAGATAPFELLWSGLAGGLRTLGKGPKAPVGVPQDVWPVLLGRAFAARRWLALQLGMDGEPVGDDAEHALAEATRMLVDSPLLIPVNQGTPDEARVVESAAAVRPVALPPRSAASAATDRSSWRRVWGSDPILIGDAPYPEGRFLRRAFDRWQRGDAADERYGRAALLQYLRVKVALWRLLVVRPHGLVCEEEAQRNGRLPAFSAVYGVMQSYLTPMVKEATALDPDLPEHALCPDSLELRHNLQKRPERIEALVVAKGEHSVHGTPVPLEWCVTLSLPRHATQTHGRGLRQFEKFINTLKVSTDALCGLLERSETLLYPIRGLDVAGRELDGPLWMFAPFLRRLLAHSRELAATRSVPPLRLTVHAGEDFSHLATGLRAIHEPFAWELMTRGDRVGHALALGLDPERWAARHPMVQQPRWERLIDLLWMLKPHALLGAPVDPERLWTEVGEHAIHLWGEVPPEAVLSTLWSALGWLEISHLGRLIQARPHWKPSESLYWMQVLMASQGGAPPDGAWRPLSRQEAEEARDRALDWVEVDAAADLPELRRLQVGLRRLLARYQATIELNPSSNLIIGDLQVPVDQQVFTRRATASEDLDVLPTTFSADDPLCFSTELSSELAYAWAGVVVAQGVAPSFAVRWLDEAVVNAWRGRFTLPDARLQAVAVPGGGEWRRP
ncbi:MAG: hypothetical protein H6741_01525 [Alphaproteobacteria bacterium]|nr:hypothetical protein [Alphaproteobacteria bacterium]